MPKDIKTFGGMCTICERHRVIYRELMDAGYEEKSKVVQALLEAFEMGKKMNNKLRQYNKGYDDGWYEEHRLDGGEIDG